MQVLDTHPLALTKQPLVTTPAGSSLRVDLLPDKSRGRGLVEGAKVNLGRVKIMQNLICNHSLPTATISFKTYEAGTPST